MKKAEFTIPAGIDVDLEKEIREILSDNRIIRMLKRNPGLQKHIENNPFVFKQWLQSSEKCGDCAGLWACGNSPKGYVDSIELNGNYVSTVLKECRYRNAEDSELAHRSKYLICDLSERELRYDIDKTDISGEESDYVDVYMLVKDWIRHQPKKGLYLYGSFGVGKTYLAACITNRLAKQGQRVAFVNIPQFFATARNSIAADYNNPDARDYLDIQMNRLKKADVAVLDDIGAENTTNWVRDDILLPVLEYRCSNEKRTLFTSNLDFEQLETKLAFSQNGQKDEIKAGRIMSRIKALAIEVEVNGPDRR